jgi:dTMP kinase
MGKRKPSRGLFITFEGTEGTGKSTLLEAFQRLMRRERISFVRTREPGGTPLAETLRKLILQKEMSPLCELFLYEAARAEHMTKVIEPALAKGQWVICDRFTDSTLAYQAHARKLDWATVEELNRIATTGRLPDITVLLDGDPAFHLGKAKVLTRFEREGVRFQKSVRAGFKKARLKDPSRWFVLKAFSKNPDEMAKLVFMRALEELNGA